VPYQNTYQPNGFKPYNLSEGSANVQRRPIPAVRTANTGGVSANTDLSLGDAYSLDANGNVYRSGPGDVVAGVINGFEFAPYSGNPPGSAINSIGNYLTGNGGLTGTAPIGYVLGVEDAKCLFECAIVSGQSFLQSQNLQKFNLADGAPDPFFGISQQVLNVSVNGLQWEVIDIKFSPEDNNYGPNARVIVRGIQML
jgi:hypothetical protein